MKPADDNVKQTIDTLLQVNKVVCKLDPSIRPMAFEILRPLYFSAKPAAPKRITQDPDEGGSDAGRFVEAHQSEEPFEALLSLVAWLYSQHGNIVFTSNDLKHEASEHGLIVPERPDMTMRQKKHNKKNVFKKSGAGFRLTTTGEQYLRDTYQVKPGKKPQAPREVE